MAGASDLGEAAEAMERQVEATASGLQALELRVGVLETSGAPAGDMTAIEERLAKLEAGIVPLSLLGPAFAKALTDALLELGKPEATAVNTEA